MEESTETTQPKSAGRNGMLIGLVAGIALTLAGVGVAYAVIGPKIIRGKIDGVVAEAVGQAIECAVAVDPESAGAHSVVHEIANMIANPANSGGYLLLSVAVEVSSDEAAAAVGAAELAIRDEILRSVRAMTPSELAGPDGLDHLSERITSIVEENAMVRVKRVLFPQFVIQ